MSTSSKSISSSEDDNELRRGPWTLEEDTVLTQYITNQGEGRWNLLAKRSGLNRTGKSCRLRWLNYLKPDVKRGNLTPEEQLLIFELHSKWGNRWAKIAQHLPGRTDNEIKNYWRTRVQKQARHLKIDIDSTEFRELVTRFWMPRFLQKAKESSSSGMLLEDQAIPMRLDSVSHDSAIGTTPTQILRQGTCMNGAFLNYSYQNEQNSDSEQKNISYIASSESANIPKVPQHLGIGFSTSQSQFRALEISDFSTFAYDDCFVNNIACMETFNLETVRAAEDMENSVGNCQMAENNWINNDFACSMWNMDEQWQFRNLQK